MSVAAAEVTIETKDASIQKEKTTTRTIGYGGSVLATVAGFAVALAIHFLIPNVQEVDGRVYRSLLAALIVGYGLYGIIVAKNSERREAYVERVKFRFAMGIVLAVWDVLSTKTGILPLPFFPGPAQITSIYLVDTAFLVSNTLFSIRLFAAGFLAGVVLGVGTGILMGWFAKVHYWVFPPLKITGVIPAVAWMPFALTVLPSSFLAGVFIIAISAWFSVAFMTAQGIATTHKVYYEVAKTLGGNSRFLLVHVALPNAVPFIFNGISTAMGVGFTTLVVSEMMGAKGGLGYYINWAKAWASYDKVYAAIIIMAILFSIIMKAVGTLEDRLTIWQKGITK